MKNLLNLLLFVGILIATTFVACGDGEATTTPEEDAVMEDNTTVLEAAPMEIDTMSVDTMASDSM